MSAHELKRDHLTRYCLFGIDSASDISMLPTSVAPGSGDLIGSTMCSINSLARGADGSYFILNGSNQWIPYKPKGGAVAVHICTSSEYDHETGMPTISNPEEGTFYLVPVDGSTGDLFAEWFYVNNAWERFGGGGVEIPQSDWNQADSAAADYIKNKPNLALKLDANQGSVNTGKILRISGTGDVVPDDEMDVIVEETDLGNHEYELTLEGANDDVAVDVSGTDPVIVAEPRHRYICGEVSTISFTPSATGICEVIFTSGSQVAMLTMPSTVIFPTWFSWESLDVQTVYDIIVSDGVYCSVMTWESQAVVV